MGRGEIDVVVVVDGVLAAVEVKTIGAEAVADDPIERLSADKLRQLRALAGPLAGTTGRPVRVDFVGVKLEPAGVTVNWRTGVA